jgi:cell division protein FtsB
VEQQAREQLKLIMPGETLYIFPKKEDNSNDEDE